MVVNCKACGKEISKEKNECTHCGIDQRNFFSKHKIISGILTIVIIGGIGLAMSKSSPTQVPATSPTIQTPTASSTAPVPADKPTMTVAEFDQIQIGMTHEQVTAIVGGPGEMTGKFGTPGDQLYTETYKYEGEKSSGAPDVQLVFQSGKLYSKITTASKSDKQ